LRSSARPPDWQNGTASAGSGHHREGLMKYFAGLDVSLDETAICIVDEDGIIITEGKAATEPADLARWIAATGLTIIRLGLEAGPLSPWLHAGLRAAGLPAICIETRRMKGATAAMAVKTDRNDARAIAHAMRVGWFTAVHVKTADSQELRLLLNNRRTLLEKRVAIDNEIRGTLKAFGFKIGSVGVAGFPARVTELLGERPRLFDGTTDARRPRGAAPARRGAT
jgi:transposase